MTEKQQSFVRNLWIASGLILLTGFTVRPLGSYLHRPEIRFAGVCVIALGLAVAVIAWLGERRMHGKNSDHPAVPPPRA